jgi:hypothetical protein
VRIERVGVLRRDARDGLAIVWLERVFDAGVLAAAIAAVALTGGTIDGLEPVLLLTAAFVLATVVAATIVPTNLREVMLHLVRRDYGPRSLHALRVLRGTLEVIDRVPRLVHRRIATLLVLTSLIWFLEFVALGFALDVLGSGFGSLAGNVLRALTGAALEAVPIQPSATVFMTDLLPHVPSDRIAEYRALLVVIPLIGGLLASPTILSMRRRSATP